MLKTKKFKNLGQIYYLKHLSIRRGLTLNFQKEFHRKLKIKRNKLIWHFIITPSVAQLLAGFNLQTSFSSKLPLTWSS